LSVSEFQPAPEEPALPASETVSVEKQEQLTPELAAADAPTPQPTTPAPPPAPQPVHTPYTLVIYCFGPFRVYQHDQLIEDWNGLKGQAILKYLVAQRGTPVTKDVLMDIFWRDAAPEAARRNLHQAIYSLRQTLRRGDPAIQFIEFESNQYMLNPELSVWVDLEEFDAHLQAGRRLEMGGQGAAAMVEYGAAEGLYQGDFLSEDVYEDWPRSRREQLRTTYLELANRLSEQYRQQGELLPAIALCQKLLMLDNCFEEAHRRLMRCYLAQGQRHLAIRQYHACVQALVEELDVPPAEETRALYEQIITKQ
jgi:DNA-binding SARP family transcriptional activator